MSWRFARADSAYTPQEEWSRLRRATYAALGALVSFAVIGLLAELTHVTFLFPSLGPTFFLLFYVAMSRQAAPRNVVCGQAIGVASGALAVFVVGLWGRPVDLTDISWRRYLAVLIAITLTVGVMIALGVEHGPAAATTLIVALGVLHTTTDLFAVVASVLVALVIAFVINRAAGLPYPWWAPRPQAS